MQMTYGSCHFKLLTVILSRQYVRLPWPENKYRVQQGAIQVNGLTEEFLVTQVLSDRYEALNDFIDELIECDLCVAHNGDFDKNFINARARREGIDPFEWLQMIDTMKN